jgi:hypothetical protein
MGTIYQLTFFLALGLLAIVIAVFVFAVSLLGRAMETAARDEQAKLAERKDRNAEAIVAIKEDIAEIESGNKIPKRLTRQLKKLQSQNDKFEKELGKIRKAPDSLTASGGVFHPCAFLLIALVLSSIAWYLSTIANVEWMIPLFIWILSLVAIGYSTYRICISLNVIQDVAITSEEAWIKKTVEAFKIAEKELEDERKPQLELYFPDEQPPFHIEAQSEIRINYNLRITRGNIAKNVSIAFWLQPKLEFVDTVKPLPAPYSPYKDYASAIFSVLDIRASMGRNLHLKVKAPSETGNYIIAYKLYFDGYYSDFKEFKLIVEEPEIEF